MEFKTVTFYCCPNCGTPNDRSSTGTCLEEDCQHDLSQYEDFDPARLGSYAEFFGK